MRDQQQYAITGHANSFPAFFTVFYLVLNCDSKRVFKHLRSSLKTYPVFAQVTCRFVVIPLSMFSCNIIAHKCAYILIERQGKESCAKNRIRNIGRRNKVVLFFFPLPRSGGGGV